MGRLTHQDAAQTGVSVRMLDELRRREPDCPATGLILFSERNEAAAKHSV